MQPTPAEPQAIDVTQQTGVVHEPPSAAQIEDALRLFCEERKAFHGILTLGELRHEIYIQMSIANGILGKIVDSRAQNHTTKWLFYLRVRCSQPSAGLFSVSR